MDGRGFDPDRLLQEGTEGIEEGEPRSIPDRFGLIAWAKSFVQPEWVQLSPFFTFRSLTRSGSALSDQSCITMSRSAHRNTLSEKRPEFQPLDPQP